MSRAFRTPRRRWPAPVAGAVLVAAAAAGGWFATRPAATPAVAGVPAPAVPPADAGVPPLAADEPADAQPVDAPKPPPTDETRRLAGTLRAVCPPAVTDDWLAAVARRFGPTAGAVAARHGHAGLVVLAAFGAGGADLFEKQPAGFAELVPLAGMSPDRRALVAGPWQRFALRWAGDGRAGRLLAAVRKLPDAHVATALRHPAALPLLCRDETGDVHNLLDRHGAPALDLLLAVDLVGHPEDLSELARGIAANAEAVVGAAEEFGPAMAYLLVPPPRGSGAARHVAPLVAHAIAELGREEAFALVLTCLDPLLEDFAGGAGRPPRSADDFREAIGHFKNLPALTQLLASDHPLTLRLLADKASAGTREPLGVRVMQRCGPDPAAVIYRYYADDAVRPAALAAIAGAGKDGGAIVDVLRRQKDNGDFIALLKRAQAENLHLNSDGQLVASAVKHVGDGGGDQARQFLRSKNLALEVQRLNFPRDDGLLEWVPGYMAVTTVNDWRDGLNVSKTQVLLATLDAVDTVTLVYGAGKKATELAGKAAIKGASTEAVGAGVRKVTTQLAKSQADDVARAVARKSTPFTKRVIGDVGADLAGKRLAAHTTGLTAQTAPLANHGSKWKALGAKAATWVAENPFEVASNATQGGMKMYQLLSDLAGANADVLAKHVGYTPVHVPTRPHPLGLNLVFRDGPADTGRVVVVEAVAAGLPLRALGGFEQGTVEYARAVADRLLADGPEDVREVARLVLDAHRAGRLFVETVYTHHREGVPTLVRVVRVVGPDGDIRPEGVDPTSIARAGLAVTLVAEYKTRSRSWRIGQWVTQQAAVGRLLGFHTWPERSDHSPLGRPVPGRPGTTVGRLPAAQEVGQVGEFAAALLELVF